MWIAMHSQISGGRADGTQWPWPHTPFQVPDAEGADLLRGGLGYRVDPPVTAPPPPEPERVPVVSRETVFREDLNEAVTGLAPGPEVTGGPPGDPEVTGQDAPYGDPGSPGDPAVSSALPPGPPRPADPKQAWVEYAVAQGTGEDEANLMTKADLMSRFGGRL
jgi:hypothetical protein